MGLPQSFLTQYAARSVARAEHTFEVLARKVESPIEQIFFTAFWLHVYDETWSFEYGEPGPESHGMFFLRTQVPIGEYRVDFVVGMVDYPNGTKIVVECDGHDFHERTKEQAARDRKRDRVLQAAGYRVFRFTGSELYRNPFGCVEEVIDECFRIHWNERK
jgi:very-short-patch-repair endonuclease